MRRPSFHKWLEQRTEEVPDSANLALVIARSGGISLDQLRQAVGIRPEVLDDLLMALVSSGQVVVLKVNGQRVYRAVA